MAERALEETQREIEETRLKLAQAAQELEERIRRRTSWRSLVRDYPIQAFAAALAIGFIVSSRIARVRRKPSGEESQKSAMAAIVAVMRPVATPVITAALVEYIRNRSKSAKSTSPSK